MNKRKERLQYLLSLTVSVLLALVLGGVLMAATGHDPLEGYGALITGAFGSPRGIGNTLAKSATLCLTGLATAVAAQAGIFNVGGEGQLYLGAMAAAVVGAQVHAPAWLVTVLSLLAAMAARILGCDRESKLLYDISSLLSVLMSTIIGVSAVFLISVAIFIKIGVSV